MTLPSALMRRYDGSWDVLEVHLIAILRPGLRGIEASYAKLLILSVLYPTYTNKCVKLVESAKCHFERQKSDSNAVGILVSYSLLGFITE